MTIEEFEEYAKSHNILTMTREFYETRLKTDLKAILVELQLEIEEKATEICDDGWWLTYNWIIQQKINELEGKQE